jgi:hypothetical protein
MQNPTVNPKTPISRAERRRRDHINEQVQVKARDLQDKFLDFFTSCENPEGDEVLEKMKQIDALWRVFCKNKGLISKAYPIMNVYMAGVVQEYFDTKEGNTKDGKEETGSEATTKAGGQTNEI